MISDVVEGNPKAKNTATKCKKGWPLMIALFIVPLLSLGILSGLRFSFVYRRLTRFCTNNINTSSVTYDTSIGLDVINFAIDLGDFTSPVNLEIDDAIVVIKNEENVLASGILSGTSIAKNERIEYSGQFLLKHWCLCEIPRDIDSYTLTVRFNFTFRLMFNRFTAKATYTAEPRMKNGKYVVSNLFEIRSFLKNYTFRNEKDLPYCTDDSKLENGIKLSDSVLSLSLYSRENYKFLNLRISAIHLYFASDSIEAITMSDIHIIDGFMMSPVTFRFYFGSQISNIPLLLRNLIYERSCTEMMLTGIRCGDVHCYEAKKVVLYPKDTVILHIEKANSHFIGNIDVNKFETNADLSGIPENGVEPIIENEPLGENIDSYMVSIYQAVCIKNLLTMLMINKKNIPALLRNFVSNTHQKAIKIRIQTKSGLALDHNVLFADTAKYYKFESLLPLVRLVDLKACWDKGDEFEIDLDVLDGFCGIFRDTKVLLNPSGIFVTCKGSIVFQLENQGGKSVYITHDIIVPKNGNFQLSNFLGIESKLELNINPKILYSLKLPRISIQTNNYSLEIPSFRFRSDKPSTVGRSYFQQNRKFTDAANLHELLAIDTLKVYINGCLVLGNEILHILGITKGNAFSPPVKQNFPKLNVKIEPGYNQGEMILQITSSDDISLPATNIISLPRSEYNIVQRGSSSHTLKCGSIVLESCKLAISTKGIFLLSPLKILIRFCPLESLIVPSLLQIEPAENDLLSRTIRAICCKGVCNNAKNPPPIAAETMEFKMIVREKGKAIYTNLGISIPAEIYQSLLFNFSFRSFKLVGLTSKFKVICAVNDLGLCKGQKIL